MCLLEDCTLNSCFLYNRYNHYNPDACSLQLEKPVFGNKAEFAFGIAEVVSVGGIA